MQQLGRSTAGRIHAPAADSEGSVSKSISKAFGSEWGQTEIVMKSPIGNRSHHGHQQTNGDVSTGRRVHEQAT